MKTRLIVAASETCADLFYATRFFAPDAFAWLSVRGRTVLLANDLEIDRARREARVDAVESLGEVEAQVAKVWRRASHAELIAAWLKRHRVRSAEVPVDFPLGLARELEASGIRLTVRSAPFWPEREIKRPWEVKEIRAALRVAADGIRRGIEVLRAARAGRGGVLRWGNGVLGGRILTSERLRAEIDSAVLRGGGSPANTIVAGGTQACDPHERGSGPLRAGELIILDVFPRDARTGYFGDLTRTVVKGRADEAQRRLWRVCLRGQRMALREIRAGVHGRAVHERVKDFFTASGYPTEIRNGRWQGFFHGTGHGLGLEIHEAPRFAAGKLRAGQVFTVEPGLYIPGIGGVRHEDVVLVERNGCSLLARLAKNLEIP